MLIGRYLILINGNLLVLGRLDLHHVCLFLRAKVHKHVLYVSNCILNLLFIKLTVNLKVEMILDFPWNIFLVELLDNVL